MLASKLLSAAGGAETIYSDDVFSTYLYTGNGSTQTITNGIDLATYGGMVWVKRRDTTLSHGLWDTARGVGTGTSNATNKALGTSVTDAQGLGSVYPGESLDYLHAFNSNGFGVTFHGGGGRTLANASGATYTSWTFRKAAKFFDCGTYTGNGVAGRQISHALGVSPGMVIVKATSAAAYNNWFVYHVSTGNAQSLLLNLTDAAAATIAWNSTTPTSSVFTVASSPNFALNESGVSYVWYAFAHDTSTDGIIQCGSYVGDGASGKAITLNWETQFVLVKAASTTGAWKMHDVIRGQATEPANSSSGNNQLLANTSDAEVVGTATTFPTSTGFNAGPNNNVSGTTYIYLAIRRPNKPPTSGTQVYNAIARTGTGAAATVTGVGFAPDALWVKGRNAVTNNVQWDRLRGTTNLLLKNSTAAEATDANELTAWGMDGASLGNSSTLAYANNSGDTYINHFFRRAPGVFDVVAYTGTGSVKAISHNLGVAPELIITKSRSNAVDWGVWPGALGFVNRYMYLDTTNAVFTGDTNQYSAIGASSFSVGADTMCGANNYTYVAYLFATKAGISKCGNYTGNGSSQTINCGFTTGARFFLVKATSATGSWWVFDSVRGVISAADPALQLNSTAAEVTSADAVDPTSVGIVVNQEATCSINASGISYVYLAMA